jgi:hypothetical protein
MSFSLLTMSASLAQTADQIMAKHIAAVGGMAKIKGVRTARYEQSMTMQGIPVKTITTAIVGKAARSDVRVGKETITTVYNGETGWVLNPMMGLRSPQDIPAEQARMGKGTTEVTGLQLAYGKARSYPVKYMGKETQAGKSVLHLTMTRPEALVDYYLDPATYLIVGTRTHVVSGKQSVDATGSFADYKRIDGLMLPMQTTITINGQAIATKTVSLSLNQPVDSAIFNKPK